MFVQYFKHVVYFYTLISVWLNVCLKLTSHNWVKRKKEVKDRKYNHSIELKKKSKKFEPLNGLIYSRNSRNRKIKFDLVWRDNKVWINKKDKNEI